MEEKTIKRAPDYAKAAGIALVVFGHTLRGLLSAHIMERTPFWNNVDSLIYLFHMPLFFYISGLFFEKSFRDHGYAALIKRNACTLLIPLAVWSYLQFSLQFFAAGETNSHVGLIDVLTAPFPPRQQFWFLGALFLIMAMTGLLLKSRNSRSLILWVMCALFAAYGILWGEYQRLMAANLYTFLFAQTLVHMPFFLLGMILNDKIVSGLKFPSSLCVLLFAASLAAYHYILFLPGPVHAVTSVLCVLSLYKFMSNLEARARETRFGAAMAFIGMNSMIIYLSHVIFAAGFRSFLLKFGINDPGAHLAGGFLSGLFLPLFLVPVGVMGKSRLSPVFGYILPVRFNRKTS